MRTDFAARLHAFKGEGAVAHFCQAGNRLGRGRACAFTLAEVLMALGLFVVAAGILSGALYSGLQAYRSATSDVQIENRYRLVLRQVLQVEDRTEFERGGTLQLPDGSRAQWSAKVNEDSTLLDLFEVQIAVELEGNLPNAGGSALNGAEGREPEQVFTLYLYRTGWADVTDRSQLLEDRRRALEERRGSR